MSSCEDVSARLTEEMRKILALQGRAADLHRSAEKLRGEGFPAQAEELKKLSHEMRREAEGRERRMDDLYRRLAGVCS